MASRARRSLNFASMRSLRAALAGTLVVLGWGLGAGSGQAAPARALPPEVAQALAQAKVPESSVAMLVVPLAPPPGTIRRVPEPVNASGEGNPTPAPQPPPAPRLAWQPDVAMNPASVMKLVTTYAGLDLLGPGYFWKTRVYTQGSVRDGVLHGNLLIQGGGDPKLVRERLADLIDAIRAKGITGIEGDILLDHDVFRLPPHDPAAFDADPLRPYNVGPDGLLINFKALVFTFVPDPGRRRVLVQTEPPMAGVEIPGHVAAGSGACGDWRTKLAADFGDPRQVRFKGRYSMRCGVQQWAVAYADPQGYAPRVIEAMWRQTGGSLSGQVRWLERGAGGQPLVTGYSLPLAEIVADINTYSNNVMAQQLFLTLSSSGDGRGSFAESTSAIRRWWRERFGLRQTPVVDNGSGLSREGRISAASLAALLQDAAQSPNATVFERSLPIAGVSGTVRHLATRSPGSEAIGNARLKSGSLRDVVAIAGYAWGRSGQRYAVVGLINDPNAGAARPALDRLVEWAVRDQ